MSVFNGSYIIGQPFSASERRYDLDSQSSAFVVSCCVIVMLTKWQCTNALLCGLPWTMALLNTLLLADAYVADSTPINMSLSALYSTGNCSPLLSMRFTLLTKVFAMAQRMLLNVRSLAFPKSSKSQRVSRTQSFMAGMKWKMIYAMMRMHLACPSQDVSSQSFLWFA